MRTLHEYLAFFQTPVLQESTIIGVGEGEKVMGELFCLVNDYLKKKKKDYKHS